jgi:hypothetical protein
VIAYNFVVGATGVVCPRGFLHHPPRNGLEIHQVVALFQDRHLLDALLSLDLVGILVLVFLLHRSHIHLAEMFAFVQVLFERVGRMNGLEGLGRV